MHCIAPRSAPTSVTRDIINGSTLILGSSSSSFHSARYSSHFCMSYNRPNGEQAAFKLQSAASQPTRELFHVHVIVSMLLSFILIIIKIILTVVHLNWIRPVSQNIRAIVILVPDSRLTVSSLFFTSLHFISVQFTWNNYDDNDPSRRGTRTKREADDGNEDQGYKSSSCTGG